MPTEGATRWWRCVLLLVAVVGVVSLSSPLGSGPDEYGHLYTSASVVRGGHSTPYELPYGKIRQVTVPQDVKVLSQLTDCFAFHVDARAGCSVQQPDTTNPALSQFMTYPRPYYLLTGIPTLVLHGRAAYVGARAVSVLLCGLMLGTAWWVQRRWWRTPQAGAALLVATTPLVLSTAGALGPSGLEICSALAAATGLVVLARSTGRPDRALLVVTAISLAVLVQTRPLAPLWAGLLVVVCLAVAGPRRVAELARLRAVQGSVAAVGVVTAAALAWTVGHGQPSLLGFPDDALRSRRVLLQRTLDQVPSLWQARIGRFGWGELAVGPRAVVVWVAAAALLLVVAVSQVRGPGRGQAARAAVASLVVLVGVTLCPFVLQSPQAPHVGLFWAARYDAPLAVLAPLLLGGAVGGATRSWRTGLVGLAAAGTTAVQITTTYRVLHRYGTGLSHPFPLHQTEGWRPFLGWPGLLAVSAALFLLLAVAAVAPGRRAGAASPGPRVVA